MMKTLALALFFISLNLYSQQQQQEEKGLIPYSFDDNKWGYINGNDWNTDEDLIIVIPAKYDEAFPFYEGFAKVKENGKFGYINKQGVYVISPVYDDAGDFFNGRAFVRLGKEWFRLDIASEPQKALAPKAHVFDLHMGNAGYVPYYEPAKGMLTLLRLRLN